MEIQLKGNPLPSVKFKNLNFRKATLQFKSDSLESFILSKRYRVTLVSNITTLGEERSVVLWSITQLSKKEIVLLMR